MGPSYKLCVLPFSMLGFCLVWTWSLCVLSASEFVLVSALLCLKMLFPWSCPLPLTPEHGWWLRAAAAGSWGSFPASQWWVTEERLTFETGSHDSRLTSNLQRFWSKYILIYGIMDLIVTSPCSNILYFVPLIPPFVSFTFAVVFSANPFSFRAVFLLLLTFVSVCSNRFHYTFSYEYVLLDSYSCPLLFL